MTDQLKKILLGEQGLVVIFIVAFALVSLLVPNFLTDRNMLPKGLDDLTEADAKENMAVRAVNTCFSLVCTSLAYGVRCRS